MAKQVKSNGTLGKVVASYPLPTIDTLLARFKDCKYFSTLNLRSGYYHIKLTKDASAKMAFVTDKGKWQLHSLPYYPCGNGKLKNSHNFLEQSIAKFLHNTNLTTHMGNPIKNKFALTTFTIA